MGRKFAWPDDGKRHYYAPNPQSEPEGCGLDIVDSLSEEGLCYEFNDFILWRDLESGKFYCASDSGCSCPMPFESCHGIDDLTEVRDEAHLRSEAMEWARPNDKYPVAKAVEVEELCRKYRDALSPPGVA